MTTEDETELVSTWIQDADKCVRHLRSYGEADALRKLTQAGLEKAKNSSHKLRVRLRPSGLFDFLVYRPRVQTDPPAYRKKAEQAV